MNARGLNKKGVDLLRRQRFVEALQCFDDALLAHPQFAVAHINRGSALKSLKRSGDALLAYRVALTLEPDNTRAIYNLANLLFSNAEYSDAIALYERVLELDCEDYRAMNNCGNAWFELGEYGHAIKCYNRALSVNADHLSSLIALGNVHRTQKKNESARKYYEKALEIDPENLDVCNNLGVVLNAMGQYQLALACFDAVLESMPAHQSALTNRGDTFIGLRQVDKAAMDYQRALEIDHENMTARWGLAVAELMWGNYSKGWELHECRFAYAAQLGNSHYPRLHNPSWQGESLRNKSILVWPEQGLGDQIMFVSCLADLIDLDAERVVVACEGRLEALFKRSYPDIEVVSMGDESQFSKIAKNVDYHTWLGSLPLYFRGSESKFVTNSYLLADQTDVERWRGRYRELPEEVTIGISWGGGKDPDASYRRSIDLQEWDAILGLRVNVVNLQYGQARNDASIAAKRSNVLIYDWDDVSAEADLDDFAAQVKALDMVVAVDNTLAHLAGALGVETFILLPYDAEWRWQVDRVDSPWYGNNVQLIRQTSQGAWDGVISDVSGRIEHDLKSRLPNVVGGISESSQGMQTKRALELVKLNELDAAMALCESVLLATPEFGDAYHIAGMILIKQGRLAEAETMLLEALRCQSETPEVLYNYGVLLSKMGEHSRAIKYYDRALMLRPRFIDALFSRSNCYMKLGQLQQALAGYDRIVELGVSKKKLLLYRADTLRLLQRFEEAAENYSRSIKVEPELVAAYWNRAVTLLTTGDFKKGWPLYSYRHDGSVVASLSRKIGLPQWLGETLQNLSILVWLEQGYGDEIQMVRYADFLKSIGVRHITWVCRPALKKLFQSAEGIDKLVTEKEFSAEITADVDCWIYSMSLPLACDTVEETIPVKIPYLSIPSVKDAVPVTGLHKPGLKVGLVWRGNKNHPNDGHRSLASLNDLAPLWGHSNANFYSLQKGVKDSEIQGTPVVHFGDKTDDFYDTAVLLAQMDLLICVDTSVAHLAGALGVPCWVLIPDYDTDWRWQRNRNDSPWYPEIIRLFRQRSDGDWPSVIQEVAVALGGFSRGRSTPRTIDMQDKEITIVRSNGVTEASKLNKEGQELFRKTNYLAALKKFDAALKCAPRFVGAYCNKAATLHSLRRFDEAVTTLEAGLRVNPGDIDSLCNLAKILHAEQRYEDAVELYNQVLALRPDSIDARWGMSLSLLGMGDYAGGWALYESRYNSKKIPRVVIPPNVEAPIWEGELLDGKTILIWSEQGIGDQIMFSSIVADVLSFRPKKMYLAVDKKLVELMQRSFPDAHVIECDVGGGRYLSVASDIDVHMGLGSLPKLFRKSVRDFPLSSHYLAVDDGAVQRWKKRYAKLPFETTVGISWLGGSSEEARHLRSVPVSSWKELMSLPVNFVDLQYGDTAATRDQFHDQFNVSVHHWADSTPLTDMDDFAAQVSALDWVVSVDNTTLHIAGAIGTRCFGLLPVQGLDWRWQRGARNTPWYPQGLCLVRQEAVGDWKSALKKVASYLNPLVAKESAQSESRYGRELFSNGQFREAATSFALAERLVSKNIGAICNLGSALQSLGDNKAAIECYRRALLQAPSHADSLCNLGKAYYLSQRFDEALVPLRQLATADKHHVEAHRTLALAWRELGKFDHAVACLNIVMRLKPDDVWANWNMGLLQLSLANFAEGWPLYELRYHPQRRGTHLGGPNLDVPQWAGESVKDISLLVYFEQGFGDEIQAVRYAELLKTRGIKRLTWVCKAPLKKLFAGVSAIDELLCSDTFSSAKVSSVDYWVYAMSLPLLCGTNKYDIPANLPYLCAPKDTRQLVDKLPTADLRVGLVWKGNKSHVNDANRSLPALSVLEPVLNLPNVAFVSLQTDDEEMELASFPDIIDMGQYIDDFADTAVICAGLDVIVCVDTAVAHLAGSLAVDCIVMLPATDTDWRWQHRRLDSPWYPEVMQLCRQSDHFCWHSAVLQVRDLLIQRLKEKRYVLEAVGEP